MTKKYLIWSLILLINIVVYCFWAYLAVNNEFGIIFLIPPILLIYLIIAFGLLVISSITANIDYKTVLVLLFYGIIYLIFFVDKHGRMIQINNLFTYILLLPFLLPFFYISIKKLLKKI